MNRSYRLFTAIGVNPKKPPGESDMMIEPTLTPHPGPARPHDADLHELAGSLETVFLTEMLAHAGVGETPEAFGGGTGEEQFASFQREQLAAQIVAKGGIGLSESLFRALSERQADV